MADPTRQGPATFAIEGDAPVGSSALPQLGTPTANPGSISPGLTTLPGAVDDVNGKTFRAITDLASGALAPKIKEAAQEQFISGVQRAMTGEALGEIVKDQPWYSDIFAPSSALAGARAYTSQQAVAQWAGKMQEQMPKLARTGPEELRSAAVGAMQGFMTGDTAADALITGAVVEQMAPLFRQHAKEHYVFVQKQATEAQIGSWEAGAAVLQGFMSKSDDMVSPSDKDAAKSRFLGSVAPFADQSDESFERNIAAFLEGAATQGSFHVVKLFKDSGLYAKISPDKRATLDRQLHAAGAQTLANATPKFAMELAMLYNDPTQNPADIPARVEAINAKAAALTGVTEASLVPPNQVDNIMGHIMTAQRTAADAAARRAASAEERQAEKLQALAHTAAMLGAAPGALDRCIAMGGCSEADAEKAGLAAFNSAPTAADKAKVLNARTRSGFNSVKSIYTETLRSPEYTKGVGQMTQVYDRLDEKVKTQYFDDHERALMDKFSAQVRAGTPEDIAWVGARNSAGIANFMIPDGAKDEASKAIRDAVDEEFGGHWYKGSWFGADGVTDSGKKWIEAMVMKTYKSDRTNNPPEVAAKRAVSILRKNGLEVQGRHPVLKSRPDDRPLFMVVGESEQGTAEAFDSLMEQKAKEVGATLDHYESQRPPDRNGAAYILVTGWNDKGASVSWNISSQEIKAEVVRRVSKKMNVPSLVGRSVTGLVTDAATGPVQ